MPPRRIKAGKPLPAASDVATALTDDTRAKLLREYASTPHARMHCDNQVATTALAVASPTNTYQLSLASRTAVLIALTQSNRRVWEKLVELDRSAAEVLRGE